jgi:hypothetical protein
VSKTAFERDGILSPEDRLASARKCVSLLESHAHDMNPKETSFLSSMTLETRKIKGIISERQLAWLRDLVSKYAA